jgi:hypothetical protein
MRLLSSILAVLVCLTGLVGIAGASVTTLDFEGVPTTYYIAFDGQNLGDYYAGMPNAPVFGVDATILDAVIGGYNNSGYPPHSGNAVLFTDTEPAIRVDFTGGPVSSVGLWYTTSTNPLHLEAYDSTDVLLTSAVGDVNYGTNSWLGVALGSNSIDHVLIHDGGDEYTIDDFTYNSSDSSNSSVPEPATILIWSILGAGSWLGMRVWRKPKHIGRRPWSPETRNAIHAIIARGNHPQP